MEKNKKKFDRDTLCDRMKKMHKSKTECATYLGMSPQLLNSKLSSKASFKPTEIQMLCEFLNIDTGEVFDFFRFIED